LWSDHFFHTSWATSDDRREKEVTAVGFEPTQLALVELESTPLDHSGKLSVINDGSERRELRHLIHGMHLQM
jgi:hypothetical protein